MSSTVETAETSRHTINQGREFEVLTTVRIGLNLVLDDDVTTFKLSTNVKEMGPFDDIVVDLNDEEKYKEKYGIQVKYRNQNTTKHWDLKHFESTLNKLYESYCKKMTTKRDLKLVLISKLSVDSLSLKIDNQRVSMQETRTPKFFLHIGNVKTYRFETKDAPQSPKSQLETFLDTFLLVTTDIEIRDLKSSILTDFSTEFKTDTKDSVLRFIDFIRVWDIQIKKIVLNKTVLQQIIALQVLDVLMPGSAGSPPSDTEQLFFKALSQFPITVFTEERRSELCQFVSNSLSLRPSGPTETLLDHYQLEDASSLRTKMIILWLTEKFPLLVRAKCGNRLINSLGTTMNFIIVSTGTEQSLDHQVFRTLNDLKFKDSYYHEVLTQFRCKLQGKIISLKDLTELNEKVLTLTTTNELILMVYDRCCIGKEENLPECHIARNLTRHIFEKRNCDMSVAKFVINNCQSVAESAFLDAKDSQTKNDERHYFDAVNSEELEWLKSSGNIHRIKSYKNGKRQLVSETRVAEYEAKVRLHLVCAMAGMGKTTIMRSIANHSSYKLWNIFLEVRNHSHYFEKKSPNLKSWTEYILDEERKKLTGFELKIFEIFAETVQFRWFWDGLDELIASHQSFVYWLIAELSTGATQHWLTARKTLQDSLESNFNVLARNIVGLTIKQQKKYIQDMLKLPEEKIEGTFQQILENVTLYSNKSILEVPLHMYILTWIFREDVKKYKKLLQGTFTIVDLYKNFVDEKFSFYFRKVDNKIEGVYLPLNQEAKVTRLSSYKRLALNLYFTPDQLQGLGLNTNERLGHNTEDVFGLIVRMIDDETPQFIHNSFGEYFAACFLFEHKEHIMYFKTFLFEAKFDNIRFFFDLMLARHSKAHTAALYRNWDLLKQCTEQELTNVDDQHRTVLHVLSSWGRRFPTLGTYAANVNLRNTATKEHEQYRSQLKDLVRIGYPQRKEKVFGFDCFALATASSSMLTAGMLIAEVGSYSELSSEPNKIAILFACLLHDYSDIFHEDFLVPKTHSINGHQRRIYFEHIATWFGATESIKKILRNPKSNFDLNAVDVFQRNLLHVCCFRNDVEFGTLLIKNVASINAEDFDGATPIQYCSENNHIDMIKLLLDNGAEIDAPNKYGYIPLLAACGHGRLEAVQFLLRNKAGVNKPNHLGIVPLIHVCTTGSDTIAKALLEGGAEVNLADNNGLRPLHHSIKNKYRAITDLLLRQNGDVNTPDKFLMTPMHYACQNSDLETVKTLVANGGSLSPTLLHVTTDGKILNFLIAKGVQLESEDQDGARPVHIASKLGLVTNLKILHLKGAEVGATDRRGRTACHYACLNGQYEILQRLKDYGVNFESEDNEGVRPIHLACANGAYKLVKLLIAHGVKLEASDAKGEQPLHYACRSGNLQVVKLLAETGINLDPVHPPSQFRGLELACQQKHFHIVKFLVEQNVYFDNSDTTGSNLLKFITRDRPLNPGDFGSDFFALFNLLIANQLEISTRLDHGKTLLHLACEIGNSEMAEFLLENGVAANVRDENGKCPIHDVNVENVELIQVLIKWGANPREPLLLHHFCAKKMFKICAMLLRDGADVNEANKDGLKLLHVGCLWGFDFAMTFFEEYCGDFNTTTPEGRSPLHYACISYEHKIDSYVVSIVKVLLSKGAQVEAIDNFGKKPLDYAKEANFYETIALLSSKTLCFDS